jgi:hypothetical protein
MFCSHGVFFVRYVYDERFDAVYPAKEVPMPDALVPKISADCMPVEWETMWTHPEGKRALYRVVSQLIKDIVVKQDKTTEGTQYIVHDMDGVVWTNEQFPGGAHEGMAEVHYGEGDLKALMWLLHHSRGGALCLLVTIDWDAAFTLMAYKGLRLHILIARVHVSKFDEGGPAFEYDSSSVGHTAASATKKFSGSMVPAFEILDMPKFFDNTPFSFDQTLVYIMAILGVRASSSLLSSPSSSLFPSPYVPALPLLIFLR